MRRSTRNCWLFAPLLALGAVALGLWLLWPSEPTITEENITKIQHGMTRAEVEAILGGPARDESHGRLTMPYVGGGLKRRRSNLWHLDHGEWIGEKRAVIVSFGDGHVYEKVVADVLRSEESLLDRFRRWLRF